MKRPAKGYVITGLVYLIIGLLCGVYYREFTKALGYVIAYTLLGLVHPHLLVLGMIINLLLGILLIFFELDKKKEKIPFIIYNTGVSLTGIMLLIRGTFDVLVKTGNGNLSSTGSTVISVFSGLGHIILAVGLIYYFVLMIKSYKDHKMEKGQ